MSFQVGDRVQFKSHITPAVHIPHWQDVAALASSAGICATCLGSSTILAGVVVLDLDAPVTVIGGTYQRSILAEEAWLDPISTPPVTFSTLAAAQGLAQKYAQQAVAEIFGYLERRDTFLGHCKPCGGFRQHRLGCPTQRKATT